MEIKRKKDKIIVEIPLWQKSYDAIGEECGSVANVIGVIRGEMLKEISNSYSDQL